MTIFGVALLALCTLTGAVLGDLLGQALGVKANVGGVGIAMMLLIAARFWLMKTGRLSEPAERGVKFWALMYIPIVVAMAATQNVAAAVKGGPIVLIAGSVTVLLCFICVWVIGRLDRKQGETSRARLEAEHPKPDLAKAKTP